MSDPGKADAGPNPPGPPRYRRVLLKISGEFLKGEAGAGLDRGAFSYVAQEIAKPASLGVQLGVVIGGGNIFRGSEALDVEQPAGDYIGMVATMINALMLQDVLERMGMETRVMSAIEMRQVAEPYIRRRAIRHLERGRVVIFGCGTGNPFFTTDTAAALRANEVGAEVLMKATNVDGVFSDDPRRNPSATLLTRLSYHDFIVRRLAVMDANAVSMCERKGLPILVFNLKGADNILKAVRGLPVGTLVDRGS